MKKYALAFVTALFLSTSPVLAESAEMTAFDVQPGFWKDVKAFLKTCAVQPYAFHGDGRRELGVLKSICPETLQVTPNRARFILAGRVYVAVLTDSVFADEGDLNDLAVRTESGTILAELRSIAAFGDVILALAGGDDDFPLEHDPAVLNR